MSKFCEVGVRRRNNYHDKCVGGEASKTPNEPKKVKSNQVKSNISAIDGKKTVQYMTPEGMKVMIIPSEEKKYYPITIKAEELERLQEEAVVINEKERLKLMEDARAEQARLKHESAVRKNELKKYDNKWKGQGIDKLSDLEKEARDKANYLLRRACELRYEDEDEVKKANSLILQAKCQAIRDAQLAEHKLMAKELKEEEKRIEQMMEDQRIRQIIEEKKKREEERAKKERYISELNEQVEDIQARRLLDAELLIEERRKTNEALFVEMLEELENVRKKDEEKRKTREILNLSNAQIQRSQAIEKEEERLADLKIMEFMRMKAEREEKYEKEKEEEKRRKEIECARQRALQEAASDLRALQVEMSAVRRQEQYEREWRKKEMEAAKKKQKMAEDIRLGREQQIRDNRTFQAMEIAREKKEFERNLKVQMQLQEKERLLELKRQYDTEVYREQILKQINQKERERIEEVQEKFKEGIALKAEEAKKKSELKHILDKKIESIRQHKVPEVYISEIHRQLNLTF